MPIIIDTNVEILKIPTVEHWVQAATEVFVNFGFVRERGWWMHKASGVYAVIDDFEMGHGRSAAVYSHRVDDVGTDYMQQLVSVPWYGDGAHFQMARGLLENSIHTVIHWRA